MSYKFIKNKIINFKIRVETGLHIGSSEEKIGIGGVDSPVLTERILYNNKFIELPYIPGSTLKGKMRTLLEYDLYGNEYTVVYADDVPNLVSCEKHPNEDLAKMFGCPALGKKGRERNQNYNEQKDENFPRTRIIFRDAFPTDEWIKRIASDETLTLGRETKGENNIDKVKGKAYPRFIERITPGVEFDCSIVLTIYEGDNEENMLKILEKGFSLLQDSYLGGHGSRGYGKISILNISKEERNAEWYQKNGQKIVEMLVKS